MPSDAEAIARRPADPLLALPAFGLMLVGFASFVANAVTLARIADDPAGYDVVAKVNAAAAAAMIGQDPEAAAAHPLARWETHAAAGGWGAACGAVSFAGGLGTTLRRWRRLALVGGAAAVLNAPHLCCVPGAAFGLWALVLLRSAEGREHFSR